MTLETPSLAPDAQEEIAALIEALLATEQRLDELNAGTADTVTGGDGRTFLLRRAQEKLHDREIAKQEAILNALPAHIALLDNHGVIISANDAWRRFEGANVLLAPGHSIGLNYLDICLQAQRDSSDAGQAAAGIRSVLDGKETLFSLEYSCYSAAKLRWFLLTVTPLGDGRSNGAIVMHLNITESKEAEIDSTRLAVIVESSDDAIIGKELNSIITSWNKGAETIFGYTAGEMIGTSILRLIPLERQDEESEILRKMVRGEKIEHFETVRLTKDRRLINVSVTVSPIKAREGRVVGIAKVARDITERKRTSESLQMSEERLRAALSASRTGTFRWDIRTNELSWDESLDALFGIPAGRAIRSLETFIATVHPDDRAAVIECCERCASKGADFDAEFRVVWPDGTLRWLDDKGKTFFDAAGRPLYMTGACVDITERKRAEATLRETEAEFRALAEAIPQMVWIMQPDGRNIYFSQQWMTYTGLTAEESLGHGWKKTFHPEDQQRAWDAWQHATATIGVYSIRCRLRGADGAYRWWLIRGVPQQDTTGNIVKWFGTCTDIHDLKLAHLEISRTNQALLDSDRKFRQLADNITDVFWITSPDFKAMIYVSAGYELIWGRSAESLYANPHQWVETILPEQRESAFAVFATLMGTTPEVSVEYQIARPDGTTRWIHDRGFQVRDALGNVVSLTGIATDITERKKLEAQLRQGQKMEAIGTLAGGIAHDFNNILAAIIGYSEMAQRGISQDSRAQAHLEQVLIASNRGRDLVLQILAFSRQEEPEREALELQPIIEETLNLLRVSLPVTVEIRQHIAPGALSVLGDATQIQQVIMNLCLNAGQAMKERGGVLEVSLRCFDVDQDFVSTHPELKEGPYVRLDVCDSGSGMDRATEERIFEPFFTTKGPGEGTGLGLAVVHGVIKNHGGAISVSSEPGVGTTFSIYLPVYDGLHASVVRESDPVPRGNGEHILFVDDEDALVGLGKSMLEHLGYRVTAMTDSVQALTAFRSQPKDFDLVITDQTMPRLKGADLARALLEIRSGLPVILVTGHSSVITAEKAKAIGIGALLFKPNMMLALGKTIQRVLGASKKE
jgi:PAS domain S-box-containing protein